MRSVLTISSLSRRASGRISNVRGISNDITASLSNLIQHNTNLIRNRMRGEMHKEMRKGMKNLIAKLGNSDNLSNGRAHFDFLRLEIKEPRYARKGISSVPGFQCERSGAHVLGYVKE
jgi:hypothetical protein